VIDLNIRLNGDSFEVNPGTTILGLVLKLELDPKAVAVERNLEIVPKSLHGDVELSDGDNIEIVEFVGGG
jgi:thiamine biosynthesis protein ThiS